MIRIKDIWVSIRDIKTIRYEQYFGSCLLIIKYMFNDDEVKIEVDNIDEYNIYSQSIADAVNRMLEVVA